MTSSALKPTIRIRATFSGGDCVCCGGYSADWAEVEKDGERVLFAEHDGHLGGSNWYGDMLSLYVWALQAVGIQLRIEGRPLLLPGSFFENNRDAGFRQLIERPLFAGELREYVVAAEFESEAGDGSDELVTKAVLPPIGDIEGPLTLTWTYDDWKIPDALVDICRHVLRAVAILEVVEEHVSV